MRASRVGEVSHPLPRLDTRHSSQRQRSRRVPEDGLDVLQSDPPKKIQIRMRRSINASTAHPTFNKVWQELAGAKFQ